MSACKECRNGFGCMGKATACSKCRKLMCKPCSAKYPLIPFDDSNPDESNDLSRNGVLQPFCKECFQETSVLDYSRNNDEFLPAETATHKSDITFIIVHGMGATRALYRPHAKLLAERGYRSILLDLPGHGTLVDKELTLDSCAKQVKTVMDKYGLKDGNGKAIYVGCSLGAYTGFYTMDKLQDRFIGAVQIDCGQNVGPDASLKARAGLWVMKKVFPNMSNHGMTSSMLDITKKSTADWKLVESTFAAGMSFDQGLAQVECLHAVAPAELIPNYKFPILYMNGSEDHRDSEDKWLALSLANGDKRSSLKVFEGGDHFFSHESKFVEEMIDLMDNFAKSVEA